MTLSTTTTSAFSLTSRGSTCSTGSILRTSFFASTSSSLSQLNAVKNKKTKLTKAELDAMAVRDMTRDEMLALNAENERVMNQELTYMTVFSLIISAPLLYLAWVGFFAETAEIAMQ
jgi:hypothetical protein